MLGLRIPAFLEALKAALGARQVSQCAFGHTKAFYKDTGRTFRALSRAVGSATQQAHLNLTAFSDGQSFGSEGSHQVRLETLQPSARFTDWSLSHSKRRIYCCRHPAPCLTHRICASALRVSF